MLLVAFYDLDRVAEPIFCPVDPLAGVAAIGEDCGDRFEAAEQSHQPGAGGHTILYACRMHDHRQQIAPCVYRDVPLASFDLFACDVTAPLPFSAVSADCKSIIARVGWRFVRLPYGPVYVAATVRKFCRLERFSHAAGRCLQQAGAGSGLGL
jgi:hypothetical protein